MGEVLVSEHALKHGLTEPQIRYAWDNFLAKQHRSAPSEDEVVAIGCDQSGRLVQIVAVDRPYAVLIYHAMTPPTLKVIAELGLGRR